jgi:uncharacterized protein
MSTRLTLDVADRASVSALLDAPANAQACYVFAHGAGAGMDHPFMSAFANGLNARGVATLRFQFPYMEQGSKRPDSPVVAQATIRAAVEQASTSLPGVPLFAGGKSFGGRMTSQAQASHPLPHVLGLVFVGFPLHAAGKPSIDRAEHLRKVKVPMLFLQGTRDTMAELDLIGETVRMLGNRASLQVLDGADHSFHVLVRSGRTDEQVREEMLDNTAEWMKANT